MTLGLERFLARHLRWQALRTRSRCERMVGEQLRARGFEIFDPEIPAWSWRGGVRRAEQRPLFPGHLFVRHAGDHDDVRVVGTRGLLGIVPDREIDAIRRLLQASLPAVPHPYLEDGPRVRIGGGPLAGVEGFLLDRRGARGLFVLSVHLFRRSVAVAIDRALAVPA